MASATHQLHTGHGTLGLHNVRHAAVSGGICVVTAFLAELVLKGVSAPLAEASAGVCLAAIPAVHQSLAEGKISPRLNLAPSSAVRLIHYELPWYVMLLSATLLFAAFLELVVGLLAGVGIGFAQSTLDGTVFIKTPTGNVVTTARAAFIAIVPLALAADIYASFRLGRWIGARCNHFPYRVALAALPLGVLLKNCIDVAALSSADWNSLYGNDKTAESVLLFFLQSLIAAALFYAPTAALGCRRGQKNRLAGYAHFLVSRLPDAKQHEFVDWAYAETQRIATREVQPESTSAPDTVATIAVVEPLRSQPRPTITPPEAPTTAPVTHTCAGCGASLATNAHFCSRCGHRVEKTVESPVLRFCPICGKELTPGAHFCGECGTPVPQLNRPQ